MRDQLRALARLAEIDAAARDYDVELKELPARIDDMRQNLRRLEDILGREREQLAGAERTRDAQRSEIGQRGEALARAKAKGAKAKSAKEADAADREIESNRRMMREREEELAKLDEAIAAGQARIAAREKDLSELRSGFEQEEQKAAVRIAELTVERTKALEGREEVARRIDRTVLGRYDRVRQRRGSGVVIISDPTCTGCRVSLASQHFIEIQRGESIEQCPSCLRMILYRPLIED